MKITKWEAATLADINSGTIAEGKIRSMRRIMAKAYNRGLYGSNGSPSCSSEGADILATQVEKVHPRVSDEQAKKGADWLARNVFTKSGAQRSTDFAQQFRTHDLDVIRNIAHFELIGFFDSRENGDRYCTLFPIYRAVAKSGAFFDYVSRAWQAGGNSFVINRS